MRGLSKTIFPPVLGLALLFLVFGSFREQTSSAAEPVKYPAACEYKTSMRKLWEDRIIWTRGVILGHMDGLAGMDQAMRRLNRNNDDIGNALKPYYGDEVGAKLTQMLNVHMNNSIDLMRTATNGDKKGYDEVDKRARAHVLEMGEFLGKTNPEWKTKGVRMMLQDHLFLTKEEAVARHQKNYEADVIAFDKVHNSALDLADVLSDAIVKHQPEKFK